MRKIFTKAIAAALVLFGVSQAQAYTLTLTGVSPSPANTSATDLENVTEFTLTFDDGVVVSGMNIHNLKYGSYDPFEGLTGEVSTSNPNEVVLTVSDVEGYKAYIQEGQEKGASDLKLLVNGIYNVADTQHSNTDCFSNVSDATFSWNMVTVVYTYPDVDTTIKVQDINEGENGPFDIAAGQLFAFKPARTGQLTLTNNSTSSNVGGNGYIIFTNEDHTSPLAGVEVSSTGSSYIYTVNVTENETYYIYFNNAAYMGTYSFTFELGDPKVVETPDNVTITPGVTVTLAKGQIGEFSKPDEIPLSGRLVIELTSNAIGLEDFLFNSVYDTPLTCLSQENVSGKFVYTFEDYAAFGPWFVEQNTETEAQFTLSFPQLDATPVELDKQFAAVEGGLYKFTVAEPMLLQVTSSVALTEANWFNMLYNNPGYANPLTTGTEFATETTALNEVTYIVKNPGTYYLHAPVAANFTLSQRELADADPFEANANLVYPYEGMQTISMAIVTWANHILDPTLSLLTGATITNPNGYSLKIMSTNLTRADDSSAENGAVALNIDNDEVSQGFASVRGTYIIYIPQGFAYDTDGRPNPETFLYYELNPTAADDEPDYFDDSAMTLNVPNQGDYLISSLTNLVVTYPWNLSVVDKSGNVVNTNTIDVMVNGRDVTATVSGATLTVPVNTTTTVADVEVVVSFQNGLFTNNQKCTTAGKTDMLQVNPPTSIAFTLYAPIEQATWTPESGSVIYSDIDELLVNVSWNGIPVFNNPDYLFENAGITLVGKKTGAQTLVWDETFTYNENSDGFVIDLSNFEYDTYTITIPAGSVMIGTILSEGGFGFNDISYALNAEAVGIFTTGDTTGVDAIGVENGENVFYNLQGIRVNNPTKGLYIINGKKVVVK